MIIFYCHICGKKGEFEKKADMQCDCGYYANDNSNVGDGINMRKTWAKTTQVEFNTTTIEESIKRMNK